MESGPGRWACGEGGLYRDEFSRRSQLALGQPAAHGTFVHLYLNGLYWGCITFCERPDDNFAASYLGGEQEDWDVITGGTKGFMQTQVKGDLQAFHVTMNLPGRICQLTPIMKRSGSMWILII